MMSTNKAHSALMRVDLSPFGGEWVALDGEKIVAHGKDLKQVYGDLKGSLDFAKILFTNVPGHEAMIL